jgi:hypothetical protein
MKGEPEQHGRRVARFTSKRDPSKYHDIDRSAHVQFFTDKEGHVHRTRRTYTRADRRAGLEPAAYDYQGAF